MMITEFLGMSFKTVEKRETSNGTVPVVLQFRYAAWLYT